MNRIVVKWKIVNPHSIINEFDAWFAFELMRATHADGWIPDHWLRAFYEARRK